MRNMTKLEIKACTGGCVFKCLAPPITGILLAITAGAVTLIDRYILQERRRLREMGLVALAERETTNNTDGRQVTVGDTVIVEPPPTTQQYDS